MTALNGHEYEEECDSVVERCELTSSALKRGLQIVGDLVDHFVEADSFLDRCVRVKHKMDAVIARGCVQKKAEHSNTTSSGNVFYLLLCHAFSFVQSV
jgi:hypothetical protein